MRTIGYVRVSTDKQDSDNQKLAIREYCLTRNTQIDHWFAETVTGTKNAKDRIFGKVLEFCQPGDRIIVSELSRISRSLFDMVEMLNHCLNHKIELYSIKDNFVLDSTPQSKIIASLIGFFAEMERERISQRTKDGLRKKHADAVQTGIPLRTRGPAKRRKLDDHRTEIKTLLSQGMSPRELGRKYGVSKNTIKTYIK